MRFLHAADVHLDSPLRGLAKYEGAPAGEIREVTRRAFRRLVDHCLEERVELLLISGDLYDGDWKDYATGLFFVNQMNRLREVGTRVVILRGNHDAQSQISRSLRLPEHVHQLATDRVESIVFEDLGIALHGRGFSHREELADLSLEYPPPVAGLVNVGMLHTSVDGRPGHAGYAPCKPARLIEHGYDYWALGHVHAREVLSEKPWVIFPGNLQGRHARETGAKGATLVTVDGGRIRSVDPLVLDVVRWERARIVVGEGDREADALERLRRALELLRATAEERPLAIRVTIEGQAGATLARVLGEASFESEVRALAGEIAPAWIEKIEQRLVPPALSDAVGSRDDAIGQLARALSREDGSAPDPALLAELDDALADLREKLAPLALEVDDERLALSGPDKMRALTAILADAERMLLPTLLEGDEDDA
ncbi:DNA repair exonuclease [soil metagenome]